MKVKVGKLGDDVGIACGDTPRKTAKAGRGG